MLNDLDQVVNAFKGKLGDSLIGAALFGSGARGEAGVDSDRDIFVIAEELPANVFERQMFLRSLLPVNLGTKVSVMGKTKKEFEQTLLPVYLDIATDAVILFDTEGYLERKLKEIERIVEKEGLLRKRVHNTWAWVWRESRGREWEIDWE